MEDKEVNEMARVVGPLFSVGARGKVRNAVVFFPLPHCPDYTCVRGWLKPGNPQTTAQGEVRTYLWNAGKIVNAIKPGSTLRVQLIGVTPAGKIWNSNFVSAMVGANLGNILAARSAWTGLASNVKTFWTNAANSIPLEVGRLAYAEVPELTPGEALFVAARGAFILGIALALTDPATWDSSKVTAFANAFSA